MRAHRVSAERRRACSAAPARRSSRRPSGTASTSRTFATRKACAPTATAAPAWSRSRASACWRRRAAARRRAGMEVLERQRARDALRRSWWSRCSPPTCRSRVYKLGFGARLLEAMARASACRASRRAAQPAADLSHPAIAVNLDACIQCTRCVRACREEQVNDVIGYAFRGADSQIVFDLDDPMGASTCVACGECVQACPTGALAPARDAVSRRPSTRRSPRYARIAASAASSPITCRTTRSFASKGATARPTASACASRAASASTTCTIRQRLTKPLIRRNPASPKIGRLHDGPGRSAGGVSRGDAGKRRSTLAGGTLQAASATRTARRRWRASARRKGSNEEAYLFQKLVRTGFGTNNVDHCTRLCHASTRRGAARRHRIGRGVESGDGRDAGRRRAADRRQSRSSIIRSPRPG